MTMAGIIYSDQVSANKQVRTALALALVVVALAVPSTAYGEACMGAGQLKTVETATKEVPVVPGKSIGPIRLGMTRRAITKAVGPFLRGKYGYKWRVDGLVVTVGINRDGRARSISADSNKLTFSGVPLAEGIDRIAGLLPGAQRSDCGGESSSLYLSQNGRQTQVGFFPGLTLPRVVLLHARMKR